KAAVLRKVVASEVHRLALDEVLHGIGGDESCVVADGVGWPERVAVGQHQHVGAEHRALTLGRTAVTNQPIDDDIALAIVVALPTAREMLHENPFVTGSLGGSVDSLMNRDTQLPSNPAT